MSLPDVYEAYRGDSVFEHLRTEGIVLVPGEGSSRPKVFIVGEAPGAMENTKRRPFVGASGQVLRSLITDAAELSPEEYFITNTVKYRPMGNRTPTAEEIAASVPYLRQEYAAVGAPAVIVAVGGTALVALKPKSAKIGTLSHAGEPFGLSGGKVLWPMIHPAYGLRNAKARPAMELHWMALGKFIRKEIG
jgi:DNA polymerase